MSVVFHSALGQYFCLRVVLEKKKKKKKKSSNPFPLPLKKYSTRLERTRTAVQHMRSVEVL